MNKKKEQKKKKKNLITRIFGTFEDLKTGIVIGQHSKFAPNLDTGNPGILWWLPFQFGRLIRKIIPRTNHKGSFCIYRKNMICQEGYCEDCQIHKDLKHVKK